MNKKTSSKAAGFGIASVWFGSHCGGGFATGTLAANYYVKYGAWALFMPLIALAIMVVVVVIQRFAGPTRSTTTAASATCSTALSRRYGVRFLRSCS